MQQNDSNLHRDLVALKLVLETSPLDAIGVGQKFVEKYPDNVDGMIFFGRAYQTRGQFGEALDIARRVLALSPENPLSRLLLVEALLGCGQSEAALREANSLEADRKFDAPILQEIGNFYETANRFSEAVRCFERVRVLAPTDPRALQNLSASYAALGDVEKAETLLDGLLRRFPHEYSAYYNRATLRKQSAERNHVVETERVLAGPLHADDAVPVLCYALAKELEDLREFDRSFAYLKRGADARRAAENYDVNEDIALLENIASQMDKSFFDLERPGYSGESPIFVLGMPRSGTTLVDRILSSHSDVGSIGESDAFSIALERRDPSWSEAGTDIGAVDYEAVGREYCGAVNGLLPGRPRILNKTPANFYYIGAIACALPHAKIVHLRRNPADGCYAIYKTLFRNGCPYSYNMEELAAYYTAYLRLMAHWRAALPGRFLDVDYEDLVSNQEAVSRRVISHCGLEWQDACLSFEKNASPSLTASAAQVRQPIYKSSVQLWRRYEQQLQPLIRALEKDGVAV